MKRFLLPLAALLAGWSFFAPAASAQFSTPPATPAEIEALYTKSIETRTMDILAAVAVPDPAKSNHLHDLIMLRYRTLRARDAAIDTKLRAEHKEINYANRAGPLLVESKALHAEFLGKLAEILTPDQIEQVKDKLTYNKVQVTYDAYGVIVPNLTDAEKAKILELLKLAREEAIDGGSAPEKSDIFQKYKDQINQYLTDQGHDVAKAFKDFDAKQEAVKKAAAETAAK